MGSHLLNILIKCLEKELLEGQPNLPLALHRDGMGLSSLRPQ